MRKLGKLVNLATREGRVRSKHNFAGRGAEESLVNSSRRSGAAHFAGSPWSLEDPSSAATNAQFNSAGNFASQEEALVGALHHHVKAALRLAKLVGEAEKAATSAERSRIAHDLHDSLTHCLTGIYTQLEAAAQLRQIKPEVADSCVCRARDLAHRGLQDIRRLVSALQPDAAEYGDLAENLRRLALESSCETGTKVQCQLPSAGHLIPPDIGYQLSQIAREAVGNALRHARAKSISLQLAFNGETIELSIEDDGVGFRLDHPAIQLGYGLNAMRQRANRVHGKFHLRTSPGAGTSIQLSVCCPTWSQTG